LLTPPSHFVHTVLFIQMTLGLHYMHTHRVLHRDLKTQNIFLTGNGRLVLGDLGISKVMTGTQDFARTCIGTPYYMSPEIFRNKPYNHKSDIWALGCVLYEMTTLNHAFDAKSLNGLAAKIVKGKYPPIHPNYSENLKQLIATVLSVNPNSRPDLEAILRKPFVKRQVQRFFADVKATNNSAANANPHPNSAANEANEAKLGELVTQLKGLDMGKLISKAAASTVVDLQPTDERVQKRRTTEQQEALKREEERRRNVEAALTRLREERKERQKGKASQPQQPPSQVSEASAHSSPCSRCVRGVCSHVFLASQQAPAPCLGPEEGTPSSCPVEASGSSEGRLRACSEGEGPGRRCSRKGPCGCRGRRVGEAAGTRWRGGVAAAEACDCGGEREAEGGGGGEEDEAG